MSAVTGENEEKITLQQDGSTSVAAGVAVGILKVVLEKGKEVEVVGTGITLKSPPKLKQDNTSS